MKIFYGILITIVLLASLINESSYALTVASPKSDPSLPQILMQVIIRDGDGRLVAYFEPTLWYITNLSGLHKLLDTKEKTHLIKEGKRLELIQFEQVYITREDNSGQITSEPLYYDNYVVLAPRHDGIIVKPGYTNTVYWKIIRTAE